MRGKKSEKQEAGKDEKIMYTVTLNEQHLEGCAANMLALGGPKGPTESKALRHPCWGGVSQEEKASAGRMTDLKFVQ